MIRVAHVVPSYVSGGIERLLENSVPYMRDSGIEYIMLNVGIDRDAAYLMEDQGVPVLHPTIYWSLKRYGFTMPPFGRTKLAEINREHPMDLIHAHHHGSMPMASLIAKELGKPFIITTHNLDEPWQTDNTLWGRYYRFLLKRAYEHADVVTCIGQAVKENFQSMGWKIKEYRVIETATHDSIWDAFRPEGDRPWDILMLGRLAHQKNMVFAMEAIAEAKKTIPGIKAAVLGDGNLRGEVEAAIKRLGLEDNVKLFGQQGPQDVLNIANESKVFFAPSLHEGLSLACVEALAQGLDAVVSTSPSFVKSFPGEIGMSFIDPHDLAANGKALVETIQNFKPRLRPHLRERFDIRTYTGKMSALYKEVVAGK